MVLHSVEEHSESSWKTREFSSVPIFQQGMVLWKDAMVSFHDQANCCQESVLLYNITLKDDTSDSSLSSNLVHKCCTAPQVRGAWNVWGGPGQSKGSAQLIHFVIWEGKHDYSSHSVLVDVIPCHNKNLWSVIEARTMVSDHDNILRRWTNGEVWWFFMYGQVIIWPMILQMMIHSKTQRLSAYEGVPGRNNQPPHCHPYDHEIRKECSYNEGLLPPPKKKQPYIAWMGVSDLSIWQCECKFSWLSDIKYLQ